jgi:hypothetical protein
VACPGAIPRSACQPPLATEGRAASFIVRTGCGTRRAQQAMNSLRQDWFSNVRNDLLAGLVVALALIP